MYGVWFEVLTVVLMKIPAFWSVWELISAIDAVLTAGDVTALTVICWSI
jgi:hypothetical protein